MAKPYRTLGKLASPDGIIDAYEAFWTDGIRQRAIVFKVMDELSNDDEFITMFEDYARLLTLIDHPSVPRFIGASDNALAVEPFAGWRLSSLLAKGKHGPNFCVGLIGQLLQALHALHVLRDENGNEIRFVSRQVTPGVVLLGSDGRVRILSGAIAKWEGRKAETRAGVLKGVFRYMSPEQLRGLALDARADVFGAGVLLYEMLAGHRAFEAESDFSLLEKVRNCDFAPLERTQSVTPELICVVDKALAKDREQRFASANEMLAMLLRVDAAMAPEMLAARARDLLGEPDWGVAAQAPAAPAPVAELSAEQRAKPVDERRLGIADRLLAKMDD